MQKFICFFFIVGFWSCTTLKPDSSQVSKQDINKRVEIENPQYYKQLNGFGYGSMAAATVVGAYAGYQTKAMQYHNGTEQKTLDVGNALIGAAVGFTVSYYANRLMGWGKTKEVSSNEEWLKKANKSYVLLNSDQSGTTIRAIHKAAEFDFTLNSLSDAQDFAQAFKNSPHTSRVIDQAINSTTLQRSDYADMADIFSRNSGAIKLKKEYIRYSSTVAELFEGVEKFPNTGLPAEQMAGDLVVNYRDVELFFSKFSNSKSGKQAFVNGLQGCTENEVLTLYRRMRQNFQMSPSEFNQLKLTSTTKAGYFNAQFTIKPPKNITEVHNKVREYSWIDYAERPMNILNQFWKIGYTTISDGDDLVASIWNLSKDPNYKYYKLMPKNTGQFIGQKLEQEIQKNVSIVSSIALEPQNPEWENWKKSTYTAGVVTTKGVGKYLIYGEIQNRSRFTIPIKISTAATLLSIAEVDMGVIGTFADGLEKVLNFFGQSAGPRPPTQSVRSVGNAEDFYIVPDFKAGERTIYATMLNFGEGLTNTGIDATSIIGGLKGKTELKLANLNQKVVFSSQPISSSLLRKQAQTQEFAKNGLPSATVHDFLRNGKEVKEAEWHAEWVEMQQQREIYEKEQQARLSSTCNYEERESSEKTICGGDKITIRNVKCFNEYKELFMAYESESKYKCLSFGKKGAGWFEREKGILGDTKYLNEYTGKLITEDVSDDSFEKAVRIVCGCQKAED